VAVPRGRYYVAVYADDVAEPTPDPGRVQVFTSRHELEHTTAHGSMVAPATSERVVAVGAVTDGERTEYSSIPSNGTVDLTAPADARTRAAPDFAGTSAAAPYVAGTAALVEAAGRDPSPARIEAILERTADGGDTVDALAAVEAATPPTDGSASVARPDRSPASDDGDPRTVADTDGDSTEAGTDAVTSATERSAGTNAADRTARNVTRTDEGDGRRSTDGTSDGSDDRTDRSPERNRDSDEDRSQGRDRSAPDNSTQQDDGPRRDGATGRER
jgi:hypothetical protein